MNQTQHIAVVDDEQPAREMVGDYLRMHGFSVSLCDGGASLRQLIAQKMPDLIVLDLNMPHWDGWTAFSKLERVTPLLPVIVITARPNQYRKAVQLGVDAFMEKPLNIPILVRAIQRLTSEDKNCHVRRITKRAFVTQLLDNTGS